jgi:putative nucleotidyltransferase-like protein
MAAFSPSTNETSLLNAALNPDATLAAQAWQDWSSQREIESAPFPELRLIPSVYAHLSRVAPTLELPNKLRGKARAVFTRNRLLAHECMPLVEELGRHCPVMLTKGLGICVRFDAWSSRPMADADIYVPEEALRKAAEALVQAGWTPLVGLSLPSLLRRCSLRRNSWNFVKGQVSVDLHWRVQAGPRADWLARHMWASAEKFELPGQSVLLQSPEFAIAAALGGFAAGEERGTALQTIVDCAWLLPLCKDNRLHPVLKNANLLSQFADLAAALDKVGLSNIVPADLVDRGARSRMQPGPGSQRPAETVVLRRPKLYRLWDILGRKARLERLMLRFTGPVTRPLTKPAGYHDTYDLRDCQLMDQIAGPGWSWPNPVYQCFWSDRADARLLVPLEPIGDHLLVLGFSGQRFDSPNPGFDVFANGTYVARVDLPVSHCCLLVPRRLLFGPWVELSFRPRPYLGKDARTADDYKYTRSVPPMTLQILDMGKTLGLANGLQVPQLYLRILRGEQSPAAKLARINVKIAESPLRADPGLPGDFDPLTYVLAYPDLFDAEVDPYHHYLAHGRAEGRGWR